MVLSLEGWARVLKGIQVKAHQVKGLEAGMGNPQSRIRNEEQPGSARMKGRQEKVVGDALVHISGGP